VKAANLLQSAPPLRSRKRGKPEEAPRAAPAVAQTWSALENLAIRLNQMLQALLGQMRKPTLGEPAPEISVTLTADHPADNLPQAIPPARLQKQVTPWGRRRIAAGGSPVEYPILGKLEIHAKLAIYGPYGEKPQAEMTRSTWYLPLEKAEKREKRQNEENDGK